MTTPVDLKSLEKKTWKSFFDDGLWDIYLGLMLGLMGVSRMLDESGLSEDQATAIHFGLLVLVMIIFFLGKRLITVPRMGRVKFKAKKRRKISGVLFISIIVGLIVWWFSASMTNASPEQQSSLKTFFPLIYALNALLVFGLIGYFASFERLYYIGVLFALPVPLDQWLYDSYGINLGYILFLIAGAIIVAVGVGYLVRFLKAYPRVQVST